MSELPEPSKNPVGDLINSQGQRTPELEAIGSEIAKIKLRNEKAQPDSPEGGPKSAVTAESIQVRYRELFGVAEPGRGQVAGDIGKRDHFNEQKAKMYRQIEKAQRERRPLTGEEQAWDDFRRSQEGLL